MLYSCIGGMQFIVLIFPVSLSLKYETWEIPNFVLREIDIKFNNTY